MTLRKKKALLIIVIILVAIPIILAGGYYLLYPHMDPYRDTVSWDRLRELPARNTVLTREQALTDLRYMVDMIADRHLSAVKGLPEKVEAQYQKEIANMPDNPRVVELSAAACRILHWLEDAHAGIPYWPSGMKQIDLELKMNGSTLICTTGKRAGQQIVSICGVPVAELYKIFLTQLSYENIYYAEHNFPYYIKTAYGLNWLGLDCSGSVEYQFDHNGAVETELYAFDKILVMPGSTDQKVSYSIDPENRVGILTLDTCRYDQHYVAMLQEFFSKVKEAGIRAIAVDLRKNGGGDSRVADEFVRYLPVDAYMYHGIKVRYRWLAINFKNRVFENDQYEELVFNGDVYVLTSKATFSSAVLFATLLRDNDLCKIIGEPPGNKPSRYGDVIMFQMPESKLLFTLTYKYFTRPDSSKDAEVALWPDYPVDSDYALDEFNRLVAKE